MCHSAREPEYRPESEAVSPSEERAISDSPGKGPERSVFSAQEIVGKV